MSTSKSPSDLAFVTSRVFDFPPEKVFSAWTNPEHLREWWGPEGFTNTFHVCDVRDGGDWKFVMHGPNGANFENHCQFVEIVRPSKIVIRHVSHPQFTLTATFEDLGGKTKVTWHQQLDRAEDYDKVKAFVPQANEQNLDKLGLLLRRA